MFSKGWHYHAGNKGQVIGMGNKGGPVKGKQNLMMDQMVAQVIDPSIIDLQSMPEQDIMMFCKGFHYHAGNTALVQFLEAGNDYGKGKGGEPVNLGKGPGPGASTDRLENDQAGADVDGELPLHNQIFWTMELDSRMRNGGMTCMESAEMGKMRANAEVVSRWQKVLSNYGCPGGNRSAKELLLAHAVDMGMVPGMMVDKKTVYFTLCKHLVLAGYYFELQDVDASGRDECFCLPATALMLLGCVHKQKPIASLNSYESQLCATCSWCVRCHGFLGCHWRGWMHVRMEPVNHSKRVSLLLTPFYG